MAPIALVTGATGFVGSHTAAAFSEAGWRVRCSLRSTSSTRWLEGLEVEIVEVDLKSGAGLAPALRDVSVVVHAAGITRASDPARYHAVNVAATARVAAAAAETGVRRLVFVSSLAARGPDGADGPTSPYGRSKRGAERELERLGSGLEVVVLRPAGVYGPRDRDLVPLFRAATRGWLPVPRTPARIQPVYVMDVASAILQAADPTATPSPGFGPYPVAERGRYSWEEVRAVVEQAAGRAVRTVRLPGWLYETAGFFGELASHLGSSEPRFDRRRARDLARHAWTCDVTATERALGWTAEVQLPEGVERTLEWYRSAGWL